MKRTSAFLIAIMITCCLFVSCMMNSDKNNESLDLRRNDKVSLFDYFSDIGIIPLETKEGAYLSMTLGEADKVFVHNNKFFLLDYEQDDILVFDTEGKYLYRLDKKGKGPEEHSSIKDFNINRFTNNIEVLSLEDQNINIYDSENFEFIDKIKIPQSLPLIYTFHHLDSNTYAFISHRNNLEIHIYEANNDKIIKANYELPKWITNTTYASTSRSPFYVYDDSLFYTHIFNGEVFNIDPIDYKLETRYKWDFGENTLLLSDIPADKDIEFYFNLTRELSNRFAEKFLVYQENSRYYFTRFKYKRKYKHIILDKTNNEVKLFDNFIEDVQLTPQHITDDALYVFVAPYYLDFVINSSFLNEKNKKILSQIKDDDNLIAIKYTFKNSN